MCNFLSYVSSTLLVLPVRQVEYRIEEEPWVELSNISKKNHGPASSDKEENRERKDAEEKGEIVEARHPKHRLPSHDGEGGEVLASKPLRFRRVPLAASSLRRTSVKSQNPTKRNLVKTSCEEIDLLRIKDIVSSSGEGLEIIHEVLKVHTILFERCNHTSGSFLLEIVGNSRRVTRVDEVGSGGDKTTVSGVARLATECVTVVEVEAEWSFATKAFTTVSFFILPMLTSDNETKMLCSWAKARINRREEDIEVGTSLPMVGEVLESKEQKG
nr:hypothetical protein Iba_chr02bCG9570 [Ipomoea batatas]